MNTQDSIAASLTAAADEVATRKATISTLLSRFPDGHVVAGWTKLTVCEDVFWSKGRKTITSGELLETLGTKLLTTNTLTHAEYYGG